MDSFCFMRRKFKAERKTTTLCTIYPRDWKIRDSELEWIRELWILFFAGSYTIYCHPEPVEGSQSYRAVSLTHSEANQAVFWHHQIASSSYLLPEMTVMWFFGLRCFGFAQHDKGSGFMKCILASNKNWENKLIKKATLYISKALLRKASANTVFICITIEYTVVSFV